MPEEITRFLAGAILVSVFALLGDLLKPKSFAGIFGAAPSVALVTLALTIGKDGRDFAAIEARSMLAGAVALGLYAVVMVQLFLYPGSGLTRRAACSTVR
jgi:hypothetical protein